VGLIQRRDYVRRQKRVLIPTPLGFALCDLLVEFFCDLFDYGFTALMEQALDEIANGRQGRLATLEGFWRDFEPALAKAHADMPQVTVAPGPQSARRRTKSKPTGEKCPQCGKDLVSRRGKYGPFVGCSGYPVCKYVKRT
jgi:DNA topoisomerase-1